MTRRGFSLVELLVVLGIIAAMTGLVLSGLFRSRDGNRLLAAEQMLADAIRQARHTARSTGAPVEVRLTPVLSGSEVVGARIAGTTRTVLWSETFDQVRDRDGDGVSDDDLGSLPLPEPGEPANGVVIGRSGKGWQPTAEHPLPPQDLPRGGTIVRSGRSDGFHLACSVKPPLAGGAGGTILPLVLVGVDGRLASSQCGIALKALTYRVHASAPAITVWDPVGWVVDQDGNEVALNGSTDPVASRLGREALPSGATDPVVPIIGGRWVEIGLLYDGQRLLLYVDGQRVAERRDGIPARLRAEGERLYLGMLVEDPPPPNPPTTRYASGPLDDVRLHRLGTADAIDLPGQVVLVPQAGAGPLATLAWRVLCHPDGRVEVSDDDASGPLNDRQGQIVAGDERRTGQRATIVLGHLHAPGSLQNAEVTITLDGRVSSRLVTATAGMTP
jgi:prepilin-type N-terminal cleavage/methylation domain-containing protein